MKKLMIFLALCLLGSVGPLFADEGMWLPMLVKRLNYVDMEKAGLKLTPEEIYSINNSSLKDAIVGLSNSPTPNGYFCSGEIVSDQGLMFTNHHCGYDVIQKHSSIEKDYLTHGFWAKSKEEELPNEALTASFLVRMENITDSIMPQLNDGMSAEERSATIRKISGKLKKEASADGRYNVVVKSFYEGNEYYLFVYEVFRDVRLVGTPPSAVGKFGGDTDNWMWPRHTGDFSIFRVYTAPDGSPADYAPENIPLKPKHFLPISLDGVKKDDFAMVWGYPGSTDRYLTSYGVTFNLEKQFPAIIGLFGKKLETWKEFMDADQNVKIQYASKYAVTANTWKYLIGQTRGLKKLDVFGKKQELEVAFTNWVNMDQARKDKYGNVLAEMEKGYKAMGETISPLLYTSIAGMSGAEITGLAQEFSGLYSLLEPVDKKDRPKDKDMAAKQEAEKNKQVEAAIEGLRESIKEHFKDYYAPADKKVMALMMAEYYNNVPVLMQPEMVFQNFNRFGGDFGAYAEYVFDNSIFASEAKLNAFLNAPKRKTLEKDPAFMLSQALTSKIMEVAGGYQAASASLSTAKRLFVAGLMEMQPDKVFYPDANSTMRMSYGTVQDYQAADAIRYNYFTTMNGIVEKEDPKNDEFIVPEKLMKLIETKDFGPYAENGTLRVCFLSTNDITGGNSGSPVINGKGELIGIAFDGNWEAMSGDIAFEPELQRTINVDIRYVLFIIDKYAGASNLIDELEIHKAMPEPIRVEAAAK
ncbi:MAG: S46 family peptidase [Bacteroidetes bacterium]|nr:S46 family peptidase [Bacteroidota bacterium]